MCAVSWATWLLFTGVPAWFVVLRLRCPGLVGSCSPMRPLGVLCCVFGVLDHLAPVHRCACSVFCFACAVSWATWLLFSGVPGLVCCFECAVSWATWLLFTGLPGRGVPSFCCPLCMCVCGVLAHVAPVHRCARCVRCGCAVGGCVPLPPPLIFFSVFFSLPPLLFFFNGKETGAHVHCRHRHGQLVQRCNGVVFSGVCRRCFGGGPAPGLAARAS